jgi:leader peptidase (prepilin peptidase)/N-methyltransferase
MGGEWTEVSFLLRFIPGLFVLLFAKVSDESIIGCGDGWVLLCLGCFAAVADLINLCMVSLTCAGIAALFMLLVLKRGRRAQIPFVPFLLIGYVVIWLTT